MCTRHIGPIWSSHSGGSALVQALHSLLQMWGIGQEILVKDVYRVLGWSMFNRLNSEVNGWLIFRRGLRDCWSQDVAHGSCWHMIMSCQMKQLPKAEWVCVLGVHWYFRSQAHPGRHHKCNYVLSCPQWVWWVATSYSPTSGVGHQSVCNFTLIRWKCTIRLGYSCRIRINCCEPV